MKIQQVGKKNMTLGHHNGWTVVYSYGVPVVMMNESKETLLVTNKKYSVTTSKHINFFLDSLDENFADNRYDCPPAFLEETLAVQVFTTVADHRLGWGGDNSNHE